MVHVPLDCRAFDMKIIVPQNKRHRKVASQGERCGPVSQFRSMWGAHDSMAKDGDHPRFVFFMGNWSEQKWKKKTLHFFSFSMISRCGTYSQLAYKLESARENLTYRHFQSTKSGEFWWFEHLPMAWYWSIAINRWHARWPTRCFVFHASSFNCSTIEKNDHCFPVSYTSNLVNGFSTSLDQDLSEQHWAQLVNSVFSRKLNIMQETMLNSPFSHFQIVNLTSRDDLPLPNRYERWVLLTSTSRARPPKASPFVHLLGREMAHNNSSNQDEDEDEDDEDCFLVDFFDGLLLMSFITSFLGFAWFCPNLFLTTCQSMCSPRLIFPIGVLPPMVVPRIPKRLTSKYRHPLWEKYHLLD